MKNLPLDCLGLDRLKQNRSIKPKGPCRQSLRILFCGWLLWLVWGALWAIPAQGRQAKIDFVNSGTKPLDDVSLVRVSPLEITIARRSGIGSANLILVEGNWPHKVTINFKGFERLEGFTICGGSICRHSFSENQKQSQTGRPKLIWRRFPGFIQLRIEGLEMNRRDVLKLEWVDFYR